MSINIYSKWFNFYPGYSCYSTISNSDSDFTKYGAMVECEL